MFKTETNPKGEKMNDELNVGQVAQMLVVYMLDLVPEKTTIKQFKELVGQMTCACSKHCSEN